MPSDEDTIYLNEKLACQQEQICKLKEKLITYDEVNDKKEQLEIQLEKLKKWLEDMEVKDNRMKRNMKSDLEIQTEKLRKAEDVAFELRMENKKLLDVNECIVEQLNTIKKNEQKILIEMDDLKICQNRIKDDLAYAKTDGEDKRNTIGDLTKTLKCKEKQCFDIQSEFNECKTARDRQNEVFTNLKAEVEIINVELAATKSRAAFTELKLKQERDTLSSEAEVKCQQFNFLEIEYNDIKRLIDKEKLKTKELENLIVKLRKANEKKMFDMKIMTQKLKEENCTKADNLRCMESQLKKQQQANECMASEIKSLKNPLRTHQCLLEKMKLSAEVVEKQKYFMREKLERDLDSAKCNLREKINKIEVLERQACELKEKIKELESKKCPNTNTNSYAPRISCKSCTLSPPCETYQQVKSCTPSPSCKPSPSSPYTTRPPCSSPCSIPQLPCEPCQQVKSCTLSMACKSSPSSPCTSRSPCSSPCSIPRSSCSAPCSTLRPSLSSASPSTSRHVTINLLEN
ncbi:Hypothetical protein CINCED_3A020926 [Cinara cedri]|uniref:Uncharacterized protein n=1 Tax=Cinara cedri TaxID=506608 RepID=A0A5E4MHR1_9HEMI|nr:Hypothetical protein CINCED_3A020926 [Cinara cedri]